MNAPALVMALMNGAWQGAILCIVSFLLLSAFRGLNAATRYAMWSALLGITLLLPVANYAFSVRPVTQVERFSRLVPASKPVVPNARVAHEAIAPAGERPSFIVAPGLTPVQRAIHEAAGLAKYSIYALYALALLIFIRIAILVIEIARMIAARSKVRPIDAPFALHDPVRRPYEFAASPGFSMPCVLGFQPALIVIPESLFETADQRELLSVVLHEHEHVMRFDDLQNVLHRLASAIGFFLPGVHLALRELAICREQICDDAAIAGIGNRYAYARTLSAMAGWVEKSAVPVPCFIFKRKQLMRRIEVLLDAAVSHSLRPNLRFAALAGAAFAVLAIVALRFQVPVFAERIAIDTPRPPAVHVLQKVRANVARCQKPCPKVVVAHVKAAKIEKTVRMTVTRVKKADPKRAAIAKARTLEVRSATSFAPIAHSVITHAHVHEHLAWRLASGLPAFSPDAWTSTRVSIARLSSGDLLDALSSAGYNNLSVDDLIKLRDHGVTPLLITSATQLFGHLSADNLVMLADHGVSSDYLAELRAAGVHITSPADAVRLRDHDISLSLMPYFGRVNMNDLIMLADSGITGIYLAELRAVGLSGLSAADIVRLRDHGVSPQLMAGMRSLGYRLDVNDLVRLADNGITADYLVRLQRIRSGKPLSIDDIIRLRDGGFYP